jgi:hypothetical protein
MGMLYLGSAFFLVCLFVIIYTSDETLTKLQTPVPKGKRKYKKRGPMSHQEIASKGANTRDPQKKAMGGFTKGDQNSNLGL